MKHLARTVATLVAFASLTAATPAAAQDVPVPVPVVPDAPAVDAPTQAELTARYASLSGALIAFYAAQQGQPLPTFIQAHRADVAAMTGLQAPQLPTLSGTDLPTLNRQLTAGGLTLPTSGVADLSAFAAQLDARASSIDATVTSAGARWAAQMATIRTPALTAPKAPGTPAVPPVPAGALAFGMFTNRAITAMVADHAAVFGQVRRSGIGTPAEEAAWKSSMARAWTASQADIAGMLPSPCAAATLAVAATGDPSASRANVPAGTHCTPGCIATGMYLHTETLKLWNPAIGSTVTDTSDRLLPPAEVGRLQGWMRQGVEAQNPQLAGKLTGQLKGADTGLGACGAAGSGKAAASTALPGVFNNLLKK